MEEADETNETWLVYISLALSFIGIFAIYLIGAKIDAEHAIQAGVYTEQQEIVVYGNVTSIQKGNNAVFITIKQPNLKVIAFTTQINLTEGNRVRVFGKAKISENLTEIIAEKISVLP
ncbi:MAG: hypothetical protein QXK37_04775 [Candidatus Woesearchaeota archaeon]